RAPEDWLRGSYDLSKRARSDLVLDLEAVQGWLEKQSASTPDVSRLEKVRDDLLAEIARRDRPLAGVIDHFAFDRSNIPNDEKAELRLLAQKIAVAPHVPVRLAGHTDSTGAHEYNVELGKKRASEVKRLLQEALKQAAPGRADIQFEISSPGERE